MNLFQKENSAQLPKVYYGLHFCIGVAEYDGGERILINDDTAKEMNPTFAGKPVYVMHQDVDVSKLQEQADGYVSESFYNPTDGKHWAKFIVVSDKGHEAISKGWKLSNAYVIRDTRGGGKWHNVDFDSEIARAEYSHLAIVPNPRYSESVILTPEEFKAYNSAKETELKELQNSQGEKSMLKFFKKSKVENSADLEGTMVALSTGAEMTVKEVINAFEEKMAKEKDNEEKAKELEGKPVYANECHMVKVGENEMSVKELVEKYQALVAPKEEVKEEPKENKEEPKVEEKKEEPKENLEEKIEEKKEEKQNSEIFNALKYAGLADAQVVDTSMDKLARGKARYGSNQ